MSEDGDALDAMCLSPLATFPGAILPCRAIAALQINQKGIGGRVDNPRVILAPDWDGAQSWGSDFALDSGARSQIEQFFLNATLFTDKDASVGGWLDADTAERLIRKAVSVRN
jgi:inorganic pyrophosphatase